MGLVQLTKSVQDWTELKMEPNWVLKSKISSDTGVIILFFFFLNSYSNTTGDAVTGTAISTTNAATFCCCLQKENLYGSHFPHTA